MKRFFRNLNWKNILIISLALVLGIGAIAGVSSLIKNEKTTLSSLEFKRGALNDLGFYIESDTSIYTKDLIECQGLEIEPDFETIGEYQVFYYDSNKQFLGKTDKINSQTDGVYVKGETYGIAKYCRIVITPDAPKDEDGHVIEDYKIKFYEVAGIANKFTISVDKEQDYKYSYNLFVEEPGSKGTYYASSLTSLGDGQSTYRRSTIVNVSDYSKLIVCVDGFHSNLDTLVSFASDDIEKTVVSSVILKSDNAKIEGEYYIFEIDIPDGVTYMGISVDESINCLTFAR